MDIDYKLLGELYIEATTNFSKEKEDETEDKDTEDETVEESLFGKDIGVCFEIDSIDEPENKVNYRYANKFGKTSYYCLKWTGNTVKFYRQNADNTEINEVEPRGTYADMFEQPSDDTRLGEAIAAFIQNN